MKKLIVMSLLLSLFLVGCGTTANDQVAKKEKPVSEKDTDSNQDNNTDSQNTKSNEDTKTDSQNTKSNEDTKTDSQSTESKEDTKTDSQNTKSNEDTKTDSQSTESDKITNTESQNSEREKVTMTDSQSTDSKKDNTESRDTNSNEEIIAAKKDHSSPVTGAKEKYIKKINDIKKGLAQFDKALETGTQLEMGQAYGEIFKSWDNALNEIYGTLEKQLSVSEMDRIRKEQRDWITYRDETAKKESLKFEGGTMESLEYVSTQARITEERCYELVEGYMK